MSDWLIVICLWVLLYSYLIVASIDFGAGFIYGYSELTGKSKGVKAIIKGYLSPVWEMTNIIFLFFFMGLMSFLPHMISIYEGGFLVPSLVILALMLIRSGLYAYYYFMGKTHPFFSLFYAISGLCIPAMLATGLTISEGGYIQIRHGEMTLMFSHLVSSFYFWAVVLLAIVSVIYISLLFLSYLANKRGQRKTVETLKGYVLLWSVPTVLASALVFAALQSHNPEHFNNILSLAWLFLLSLVCLMVAITLIFLDRLPRTAFFFGLLQFLCAFFGYGISHLPYIVYPDLMLEPAVFHRAILNGLFDLLIVLVSLIIPICLLSFRLFLMKGWSKQVLSRDS
ncbi:cytochrome D ubiquinol oxidase subunit II [Pullulanibacillus camelliae]|uniref:Cytochrome D ubiquinol oxidase subunit II n=1 Tax=Pullulanibacillus camelliae TaxID=1707096 RepID=A0A8J2VNS5_9BACL|nr:cytochrome d ubiquinol oxidase subunit II [Pullulanibacillus camelliae]GGE40792.1 cytochrome D ubiquinol oxidase subunit II [Pullulanibacillus camelliae]